MGYPLETPTAVEYAEDEGFKYGKPFGVQDLGSPQLSCGLLGKGFP